MKHRGRTGTRRFLSAMLILLMTAGMFIMLPSADSSVYAASTDASAKINADGGAILRKSATAASAQVAVVKDNAKITIISEVFTSKTSAKAVDRWYYIASGSKKGYVRADLVDSISYASVAATTTDSVNYRAGAGTSMAKKGTIGKGKSVTVQLPALAKGSTGKWYRVKIGSSSYYMSGSYLKFGTASATATTTAKSTSDPAVFKTADDIKLSGVSKPIALHTGQGFGIKGVITVPAEITKVVIGVTDESGKWHLQYSANVKAKTYNLATADKELKFGTLSAGNYNFRVDVYIAGKCYTKIDSEFKVLTNELAAKLLGTPTNGGSARNVYTFSNSNCQKLFAVTGYGKAKVPQGMSFDGSNYYFVYGMSNGQAIVTYSANGKRVKAQKFPYNMGHPNGITYDPVTGVCYIFKGNQKRIHSWNPSTGRFSKLSTPYSSSGIAYDNKTGMLYATSRTGIRAYSANGKFSHQKLFKRCSHGIFHYIQDCGAAEGLIFHGVSGANKHATNFLDIYRGTDGKYLGSIKITLGEIESVVVGKDGYVQLLVNNKSTTDYVWKTPLNIKDLI